MPKSTAAPRHAQHVKDSLAHGLGQRRACLSISVSALYAFKTWDLDLRGTFPRRAPPVALPFEV
jgi:hypothetical protein